MGYRDEREALQARLRALEASESALREQQAELLEERETLQAELAAKTAELQELSESTSEAAESDGPPGSDSPSGSDSAPSGSAGAPGSESPGSESSDSESSDSDSEAEGLREIERSTHKGDYGGSSGWREWFDFLPWWVWVPFVLMGWSLVIHTGSCVADGQAEHPAELRWRAEVRRAERVDVVEGAECEVTVKLRSNRQASFAVDGLIVRCADKELYDWGARYRRLPSRDDDDGSPRPDQRCPKLVQRLGQELRYGLVCRDIGGRAGGRPQMMIDTATEDLVVFSEVPPLSRVELSVEPLSEPWEGQPLLEGTLGHPVTFSSLFE